MVDRRKRDVLAEKLRQLLSGSIDNLVFDDLDDGMFFDSDDEALRAVFHSMWTCYDDFRSHPLRLTEGQRLDFVRCVLFLHSDLEFQWPVQRKSLKTRISHLLTRRRHGEAAAYSGGDVAVFPFYCRSDYEAAMKSPRLLSGMAG